MPSSPQKDKKHRKKKNIETDSEDDKNKDPDYIPSGICTDDSRYNGEDDDDDNDSEEEDGVTGSLMLKLAPLLRGLGSSLQMPIPMMVVIHNNQNDDDDDDDDHICCGEENDEDEYGYDDEDEDEDDDEDEDNKAHEGEGDEDEGLFDYENDKNDSEQDDEDAALDRELRKVEKRMIQQNKQKCRKRKRSENDLTKIMKEYNREERTYIGSLPKEEKDRVLQTELRIRKANEDAAPLPMRFKILNSPMDDGSKRIILAKLEQFRRMHDGTGEYFKLRNWLNSVNRLPLGRFKQLPINASASNPEDVEKVSVYLSGIKKVLDDTVYGHIDAKEQILRILAQWISNPGSCGHCIGIQGSPGCGKTSLVKDGICKALELPFSLISLGCYGSDGSALTGHHFTYEGSTYGKIAEALVHAQYMNPILYFDELDKISATPKGEEVANVLIHLTDSTQNDHFNDNYFSEIPLDMSKCLIIFSYNDESLINPILKDRMITIHVKGYTKKEKLEIAQNYLIPRILKTYNLNKDDIVFDISVIDDIIERVPHEEGVRNLKRGIDSIISWINMLRYVPNIVPGAATSTATSTADKKEARKENEKNKDETPIKIEFPIKITSQLVKKYIKKTEAVELDKNIMATMYT
ncbi:Lon protease [Dishui Lake large algae virus 1]|nr:Lon protease [Dishui Lake large algae virus 1]